MTGDFAARYDDASRIQPGDRARRVSDDLAPASGQAGGTGGGERQRTRPLPVPSALTGVLRASVLNYAVATLGGETLCIDTSWMESAEKIALLADGRFLSFDWLGYESFGHKLVDRTGKGQVIDAAMCDGTVSLTTVFQGMVAEGSWRQERADNLLDGGAPWYGVYECADGGHVAVGAIEPQFWREFCTRIGLEDFADADRDAPGCRERIRAELTRIFRSRSRDEWAAMLENSDACVTPVLTFREAQDHPHLTARETFTQVEGMSQPAPAPRFSRTPSPRPRNAAHVSVDEALDFWRD